MTKIGAAMVLTTALLLMPSVSQAKGCIKGALIGGVAGHFAGHHGILGAAAGCIIGRHQAHAAQKRQQTRPNDTH
jgi:hypothetical protein